MEALVMVVAVIVLAPLALAILAWLCGIRYIPHNRVGIIEKLWSPSGSLAEGRIIARQGEAGFQTRLLRGGLHFGLFPWQYRIHREPLISIAEGKIGYIYARDGAPLPPMQTLGSVVECNSFQDAHAFLDNGGQRGRQRAIVREGVYAINQALFVVITEDWVYTGPIRDKDQKTYQEWQAQLYALSGFNPVIIGASASTTPPERDSLTALGPTDTLGVVTVHDGPPIAHGEIIAPEVHPQESGLDHHYFQDAEAFLAMGGRRGAVLAGEHGHRTRRGAHLTSVGGGQQQPHVSAAPELVEAHEPGPQLGVSDRRHGGCSDRSRHGALAISATFAATPESASHWSASASSGADTAYSRWPLSSVMPAVCSWRMTPR